MHVDREIQVGLMLAPVYYYKKSLYIVLERRDMTYRVKQMVIATFAGLHFTFSDLRPKREEQHPNAGQPHEDTPAKKGRRKEKESKRKNKRKVIRVHVLKTI